MLKLMESDCTQLCKYIHIIVKCGPRQYEGEMWVEISADVTSNISALYHRNSFISAQQLSPQTLLV